MAETSANPVGSVNSNEIQRSEQEDTFVAPVDTGGTFPGRHCHADPESAGLDAHSCGSSRAGPKHRFLSR